MTVRSTEGRETLLKLALPAPQGSGNAAGRLTRHRPAAVRQLDDFLAPPRPRTLDLAFLDIVRAGGEFPDPAQALFGAKPHKFPCVPSPCYMSQGKLLNLHWEGGAAFLGFGVGNVLGEPIMFA